MFFKINDFALELKQFTSNPVRFLQAGPDEASTGSIKTVMMYSMLKASGSFDGEVRFKA